MRELNEKLIELEKQVMTYRERVLYHESVEDELKRNIESQVDVVLKMEEERLLLLRECKELREKNKTFAFENQDMKDKITMFEGELEELQEQISKERSSQPKDQSGDEMLISDTESIGSKAISTTSTI